MERYLIKYGPEIINEFSDFEDAVDWLIDDIEFGGTPSTQYVYDIQEDRRYDYLDLKDMLDDGIGWNDHLER